MTMPALDFSQHFARRGEQPFDERHATMPWAGSMPIRREAVDAAWRELASTARPLRTRLLYVHIPFCSTHCSFCGFYQNRYDAQACQSYTDALIREIESEADSALHQSAPIQAIYVGGGTPSALSASDLHRILVTLQSRLPMASDCEITIEGRILNFDDEKIEACLEAGANRFSIGIQSFDTQIRRSMGRTSSGEKAVQFLDNLSKRGRATIVCDLLFGLPGQSRKCWEADLRQAAAVGIDGIDLYALNLFSGTQLGQAVSSGRTTIPTYSQCRDFYLDGCRFLEDAGWRQISNSHWARTGLERNFYNLAIKQGADCLAFGSGAGGSVSGFSWMEERALDKYTEAIEQGRKPILMMMRSMDSNYQWRQDLQGGIEAGVVELDAITPCADRLLPLLLQWHQAGLIEEPGAQIRLTYEGRFWASNLLNSLQTLIGQILAPNMPAHGMTDMAQHMAARMEKEHGSHAHPGTIPGTEPRHSA